MIFIVVKFETKPEWTDRWPELVAAFTAATRAEEGNLWFEWSRSLTTRRSTSWWKRSATMRRAVSTSTAITSSGPCTNFRRR